MIASNRVKLMVLIGAMVMLSAFTAPTTADSGGPCWAWELTACPSYCVWTSGSRAELGGCPATILPVEEEVEEEVE